MNDLKILVDTNVILDFFLSRSPNEKPAEKIFESIYKEEITAFTTASSVTDIYYIVAKRLGNKAAKSVLHDLFNLLGIISVDSDDCHLSLELPLEDFEDALISTCAKKEDVDYIVSNDTDFLKSNSILIPIISAADFVAGNLG
jgi:predicted nucleic acid-binding protein